MEFDGKNLEEVTKISVYICKLLMGASEYDANLTHTFLASELGNEGIKFLLKESFLTKGEDLDHYWDGDEIKDVDWHDHLNSFTYLSLSGLVKVSEDDLKSYDINFSRFVEFLAKELDVLPSSRTSQNELLDDLLYFVGNAKFGKRTVAVFFARKLIHNHLLKKVDEFFTKESPTALPKLILTSSNESCLEFLPHNRSKIISIPKLLNQATERKFFNVDYITNVLFANVADGLKPYIHCTEDGSTLFVGDKNWSIKGDKQRQIIKVMCDSYAENPDSKMRWGVILSLAELDETTSRFNDLFKRSSVKDAIGYGEGFVWFKTENS